MSDTIKTITKYTRTNLYISNHVECILDQFSKAAILDLNATVKNNNKLSQNRILLRTNLKNQQQTKTKESKDDILFFGKIIYHVKLH